MVQNLVAYAIMFRWVHQDAQYPHLPDDSQHTAIVVLNRHHVIEMVVRLDHTLRCLSSIFTCSNIISLKWHYPCIHDSTGRIWSFVSSYELFYPNQKMGSSNTAAKHDIDPSTTSLLKCFCNTLVGEPSCFLSMMLFLFAGIYFHFIRHICF